MSKWLAILVLLGSTGVVGWRGVGRMGELAGRVDTLEGANRRGSQREAALEAEIDSLTSRLDQVHTELEVRTAELTEMDQLLGRLGSTESQLSQIEGTVDQQERALASLRAERATVDPDIVEAHFATLDEELRDRWADAIDLASSAAEMAGESREQVDLITRELAEREDHEAMWRQLVAPVAQLAGEESVGSGVVLESIEEDDGNYLTYVITAWHVVRDIQGDLDHTDMPVPVALYAPDGSTRNETATLLAFDPGIDIALLRLDTELAIPNGAKLAPRVALEELKVFDRIYAVGCPLGNAPIPTPGEIAAGHHYVDGEIYVMINAPTYVGNSGGGIFSANRRELLGIFSKVYTHGAVRPTIVTHMGLITPMDTVYDWLHTVGYGDLEPADE